MIPIGIVGVFFKDYVEEIFGSGLLIVGCMLLLTALAGRAARAALCEIRKEGKQHE